MGAQEPEKDRDLEQKKDLEDLLSHIFSMSGCAGGSSKKRRPVPRSRRSMVSMVWPSPSSWPGDTVWNAQKVGKTMPVHFKEHFDDFSCHLNTIFKYTYIFI